MNVEFRLIAAFAAGAVAMYCLDPVVGRRRRAQAADRMTATRCKAKNYAFAKSKRAANRAKGVLARTKAKISHPPLDDEKLQARIRAKIGRMVEHPGALEVAVHNGRAVLTGSAMATEIDQVVEAISAMQGIEGVDYGLSMRDDGKKAPQAAAPQQTTTQH